MRGRLCYVKVRTVEMDGAMVSGEYRGFCLFVHDSLCQDGEERGLN